MVVKRDDSKESHGSKDRDNSQVRCDSKKEIWQYGER